MTNRSEKFHKVGVLRMEWDVPEYYDNLSLSRRSAFGIYCIAQDRRSKTSVEIKRWNITGNRELARKAYTELKMLKTLSHRNIISVTESFFKDNKLYFVTDVMQDNLNNIIRSQRFKSDDIRYIIYQILNALNYMHKCGIVHGDLKPGDIGINRDFHIKLIDLNVERPRDKDYVLTKWYQAPELIFGWKKIEDKVDLWSIGCILAEFICGRIIFAGRDHLQQLRLILELLGTPPKDFFTPPCHFCIITQNLMTGEKFVRSLPYLKKKPFRRAFEECEDEDALDLLEKLLQLEPADRIDSTKALAHAYVAKHADLDGGSCQSSQAVINFDEVIQVESEDWLTSIEENVDIKD